MLKKNGTIDVDIFDGRTIEVSYTYVDEPSCHYDVEPYRDLNYWSKEVDIDSLPLDDQILIENLILDDVNGDE
jgi:hypothetical protein